MTSRPTPQCLTCYHWISPLERDDEQARGPDPVQICAAFPDAIPDDIWWNQFDHRHEHAGDHGIQWEPLNGFEFPEWEMNLP